MDFEIRDAGLRRLAEGTGDGKYPAGIGKVFRKRIQTIDAAPDERTIRNLQSLRFEKLKGNRSHERSIRLNSQYRLIVELEEQPSGNKIVVKGIEDYH